MIRRKFLTTGIAGLTIPLLSSTNLLGKSGLNPPRDRAEMPALGPADVTLLRDMQRRCLRFFMDAAHPDTGLISDRAATDGAWFSEHASSAACGFGLASFAVAAKSGWMTREDAAVRIKRMLSSLLTSVEHENGFVYHFFSRVSGQRSGQSEASSIDTAIMIAGALTASSAFANDTEIASMVDQLYRRVKWNWLMDTDQIMSMGWTPESGTMPQRWESYSEMLLLLLLAIGAPSSPVPPEAWTAWRREPKLEFNGEEFLTYPPLFVHQYPHTFFDFRDRVSPSGRNYWRNSIVGHDAHLAFLEELGKKYPDRFEHYGPDLWGLTSSDSATGYRDWGGPYEQGRVEPDRGIDGTIVPSAAAGGLAVVPEASLRTLRYQREKFGDRVFGKYGFVNAFNPATGWVNPDVIGIDTGISMLMAENLLEESVWSLFMAHPAAELAFQRVGFRRDS